MAPLFRTETLPSPLTRVASVTLALGLGLWLAGCATDPGNSPAPDNPGSAQSDPGASEPNTPAEQSTAAIPDAWPEAIRIVTGPVVEGADLGDMLIVTVAVEGDGQAIFKDGVSLLEGAGHTVVFVLDDDDSTWTGQWKGEGYWVNFEVSHTDGVKYANYTVTIDS